MATIHPNSSRLSRSLVLSSLALCLLGLDTTLAFAPRPQNALVTTAIPQPTRLFGTAAPPPPPSDNNNSNMPDEENTSYTGSIDWDEEWKKVMRERSTLTSTTTTERPGKDYYKTEAEIAAIRAANKATKQVNRVAEDFAGNIELPTWNSVKGDWKFWIGVLAAVSVGGALLSGVSAPTDVVTSADSNASSGSYFI